MTDLSSVDSFLAEKKLAIAGVSRSGKKFGNSLLRELQSKGYELYPIHPSANEIDGVSCYHDVKSLPCKVGGLIVVLHPSETEKIVAEAAEAGINKIWLQNGAESDTAIEFCQSKNIDVVHHKCVLMFAQPSGFFHKAHRWIWNLSSKN